MFTMPCCDPALRGREAEDKDERQNFEAVVLIATASALHTACRCSE